MGLDQPNYLPGKVEFCGRTLHQNNSHQAVALVCSFTVCRCHVVTGLGDERAVDRLMFVELLADSLEIGVLKGVVGLLHLTGR